MSDAAAHPMRRIRWQPATQQREAMTRPLALMLAAVLAGSGIAGCGGEQPPVCSSVAQLQKSVDALKDVNVSADGVSEIRDRLSTVGADYQQVKDDAKAQYATELDRVDAAVAGLRTSVTTARQTPDAASLNAVGAAVNTLVSSVQVLADDVSSTC
jgi:hypothetical protein